MSFDSNINKNIDVFDERLFLFIYSETEDITIFKNNFHGVNIIFAIYSDLYFENHIFLKHSADMYIFYMKNLDIELLSRIGEIKRQTNKPVIVISDHHNSALEVAVLRLGADDYWSMVNTKELFRIRTEKFFHNSNRLSFKNQRSLMNVLQKNTELADSRWNNYFTLYELIALTALIENPGEIVTRENLSLLVRGRTPSHNSTSRDRSADNLLSRIRAKLKRLGVYRNDIKCFNSIGYAFIGDRDELVNALDARFAESSPQTPGNNAART